MASIWNPDGTIVPGVNADLTVMYQEFTATASQTVFNLTTFVFQPATNSLTVLVNGVDQVLTQDYTEGAAGNAITFTSGLEVGDQVIVRGFVGSVASQTAAASASAAYISSQNAETSATSAATSAASATSSATSATNSASAAALSATNSANSATAAANSATAASASATAANQTATPFAVATGTSDTITANYATANTALVNGYNLTLEIVTPNTTATPTLTPTLSGVVQGAATIVKMINNTEVGLKPGDLQGYCWFKWNSVTSHWVFMNPLDSVLGGSIQVTSAVSLNLTVNSQRVQVVNMTTAGQNVQLPDATTIKDNQGYFMISNQGSYTFNITDGAGNLLKLVSVGATVDCVQLSNSTVAGQWLTKNSAYVNPLYQTLTNWGEAVIVNASSGANYLFSVTSSTYILFYVNGASGYAVLLTVTNNTVTCGSPVLIPGVNSTFSVDSLSATQFIVTSTAATSPYYINATTVNVAGNVITVNAEVVSTLVTAGTNYFQSVVALSSAAAVVMYYDTTTVGAVVVVSIAGTVPTFNTPVTFIYSSFYNIVAILLGAGSNSIFVTAAANKGFVVNVVGTVPSVGAAYTLASNVSNMLLLTPTTVLCCGSSSQFNIYTISGTTFTYGANILFPSNVTPADFRGVFSFSILSTKNDFVFFTSAYVYSSYYQMEAFYCSFLGSSIEFAVPLFDGSTNTVLYPGSALCTINTSTVLGVYNNASGYLSARVISLN